MRWIQAERTNATIPSCATATESVFKINTYAANEPHQDGYGDFHRIPFISDRKMSLRKLAITTLSAVQEAFGGAKVLAKLPSRQERDESFQYLSGPIASSCIIQ